MNYARISYDLGTFSLLIKSGWHKILILLLPPSNLYYCEQQYAVSELQQ